MAKTKRKCNKLTMTERQFAKCVRQMGSGIQKMHGSGSNEYGIPHAQLQSMLEMHPLADMSISVQTGSGFFDTTFKKVGSWLWNKYGKDAAKGGLDKAKDAVKDLAKDGVKHAIASGTDFINKTAKKHDVDLDGVVNVKNLGDKLEKTVDKHTDSLLAKADSMGKKAIEGSGMEVAGAGHCMHGKGMHGDGMEVAGAGHCMHGKGMEVAGAGMHGDGYHGQGMHGDGMKLAGAGADDFAFRSASLGLPPGAVTVSPFNHLSFAPQAIAGDAGSY